MAHTMLQDERSTQGAGRSSCLCRLTMLAFGQDRTTDNVGFECTLLHGDKRVLWLVGCARDGQKAI